MEPHDLLEMSLRDVSGILAERLIENKKRDIHKSYIVLDGTSRLDGSRVTLTIELKEKEVF